MAPAQEKSALKRAGPSVSEGNEVKKPRRSARLREDNDGQDKHEEHARAKKVKQDIAAAQAAFPSPVTNKGSTDDTATTMTVSPAQPNKQSPSTPVSSPPGRTVDGQISPPEDTQPFSQFLAPPPIAYEVEDEEKEGVWGYLVPLSGPVAEPLIMRSRAACPVPQSKTGGQKQDGKQKTTKKHWKNKEEEYEFEKGAKGTPSGGFLLGRHMECDRVINVPTVSNRHALLFSEKKDGDAIAVIEDLSGNGTYVNDAIVGRNKRRVLHDGDEISILDQARFIFRYPRRQGANAFRQHYTIQGQLGKGHFATVYLATEKSSGLHYAVKKFEKRSGPGEKSKIEGLQQEIAVLMGVAHPNMLCLKDTYDEQDGAYLVLELAPEGELFNWIVMKQKLTEVETRKVFIQLFQGVKYLHERNIVHRDIKPENILLADKDLHIKLADFGLAKIIGEESFTTTLCGTPSYVAPEILEAGNRRRYTRAVDVWSLGVVLYICLCGFPPFSDELYSAENPYTLSQQIKMGRFDYPSPYWDSVGDPALDLIDRMLTVDVEKRITIDECLEHPWTTNQTPGTLPTMSITDSTEGLTGALAGLDFSKRKPQRERTLLSSINDVKIERVVETQPDAPPVKVFGKNSGPKFQTQRPKHAYYGHPEGTAEPGPDAARDPKEFVAMGGKGDQLLYDGQSNYPGEGTAVQLGAENNGMT